VIVLVIQVKLALPNKTAMRKIILPLLAIVLLMVSCAKSEIRKKLSEADEVVISFSEKNNPVRKTVSTSASSPISRIIDFIEGKEDEGGACTENDGVILFNKGGGTLQIVTFTYIDECRQFYFTMDGKTYKTVMKKEAVDFFKALAAGKDIYW
jgi:hypothetical protein